MIFNKQLGFLACIVMLSWFSGCYSSPRKGKPNEPSIYALVWLGEPIRLPSGEGKSRTEVLEFREGIFRDEVNVLRPALEDPAIARLRRFGRDERWLKDNLRIERLSKPEALRSVLARGQGVVRVCLTAGSPEEQVAFINAVVRAWDNAFFARQRGNQAQVRYKEDQKRAIESLRKQKAELAALNRKLIPEDPDERKSLEGRKRVEADFIRQTEEAIRNFSRLIEKSREAQLKLPVVLEWAKTP